MLRRGLEAMAKDREFIADAERSKIEVNLVDTAEVERTIALITSAEAAVKARYSSAMK